MQSYTEYVPLSTTSSSSSGGHVLSIIIILIIILLIVGASYYFLEHKSATSTTTAITTTTTNPPPPPTSTTPPPSTTTTPPPTTITAQDPTVCIDGDCLVEMKHGMTKRVRDLRRGDITSTGAKIECVITNTPSSIQVISITPYLRTTNNHPIRHNHHLDFHFQHPIVTSDNTSHVPQVFNLVLDKDHFVMIDGYQVLTLGHNIENDPVATHPYFGTHKIVNDLKTLNGWENGFIELARDFVWKRNEDGHVIGIIDHTNK